MKLLEDKIKACGKVLPGEVLKVDSFLNHQLDVALIDRLGEDFYSHFRNSGVNKILTVESSGIALACAAARCFQVPVVFGKKGAHKNVGSDVYTCECFSYTKGTAYSIIVSKSYINADDRILIIDDFLANGAAVTSLMNIIAQAGAELVGVGIAIEKGFQPGGKQLRDMGIDLQSLAVIESMTDNAVTFRSDN